MNLGQYGHEAAMKMRMEMALPVASVRNYASEPRAASAMRRAAGEHKYEKVGWLQALARACASCPSLAANKKSSSDELLQMGYGADVIRRRAR